MCVWVYARVSRCGVVYRNVQCDVVWLMAIPSVVVNVNVWFASAIRRQGGQTRLGRAQTRGRPRHVGSLIGCRRITAPSDEWSAVPSAGQELELASCKAFSTRPLRIDI